MKLAQQFNAYLIPATFALLLVWLVIGAGYLSRIEANQATLEANQIELIENLAAISQDSFHSNE